MTAEILIPGARILTAHAAAYHSMPCGQPTRLPTS